MQQSIRYKGLSLTPDEMAVENGALSLCGNLELHDGALRPSIVAGTPLSQPLTINGVVAKILYVHETGNYHHLIAIASSAIYWFLQDGSLGSKKPIKSFDYESTVLSIDSIGNTLIIVATDGIHYAMWESNGQSSSNYSYKGKKPPFLELSFFFDPSNKPEDYELGGINTKGSKEGFYDAFQQTTYSCGDVFNKVNGNSFTSGDQVANIKDDKQSDITQSIYALVNRTNNLIAKQGRFYASFFIRYCYRMFDGSMIMHSSPVFIPIQVPNSYSVYSANISFPSENYNNLIVTGAEVGWEDSLTVNRKDAKDNVIEASISKCTFMYLPHNVALSYALQGDIDELKRWKDIIKSIDIFITPPVTNVDTSVMISVLEMCQPNYVLNGANVKDYHWTSNKGKSYGMVSVRFPKKSDDDYNNQLSSAGNGDTSEANDQNISAFYKICSLPIDNLTKVDNKELPVDKAAVYQVSLQEQMQDDYKTHNFLTAKGSYVYNHRLNLFGVQEHLMSGFCRKVMFPKGNYLRKVGYFNSQLIIKKIVTELHTTSGTKYVENVLEEDFTDRIEPFMLANLVKYYPDSRAKKMVFFCTTVDSADVIYAFPLKECEELNGAMHMGNFTEEITPYIVTSYDYSVDDVVDMSNKIYTSESDNAFYFPLNGINTVGIGTIQGIASTTRALSQGQFGQYPLMAFSTDGIWAMEVSSKGTYSSIHPISREVCSNPKSITQLDQSVLFATNRSLSRIAESQVVSMSDVLDGPGFNISGSLGKLLNFFIDAEGDSESVKTIKAQMRQLIDFTSSPIEFFQHCQVIYDYKNSRIFCLDATQTSRASTADTVALCYSIKDNAWSTFLIQNVLTAINSYPHPYIQYRDGSVMVLDKGYDYEDPTEYHGIIVTRTLKFDEDNVPDSITGYIHSLTSGSIPIMWLYGSNDNQNWHYIGRMGGMKSSYMATHSYRFFRIALYLKMKSMNQYFDTRLEIIRRFSKF